MWYNEVKCRMEIENTKIGKRLYIGELCFWFIPADHRLSISCDKEAKIIKHIPREFWDRWNNASIAQRSFDLNELLSVHIDEQ